MSAGTPTGLFPGAKRWATRCQLTLYYLIIIPFKQSSVASYPDNNAMMFQVTINDTNINNNYHECYRRELLHGPKTAMYLRQVINFIKMSIIRRVTVTLTVVKGHLIPQSTLIFHLLPLWRVLSLQFPGSNVSRYRWSSVGRPSQFTGNKREESRPDWRSIICNVRALLLLYISYPIYPISICYLLSNINL